jgi:Tfp pilus assembly protein PilF
LTLLGRYPTAEHLDPVRLALGDTDPLVRAGALSALDGADLQTRVSVAFPLLEDPVRMVRLEAARILAPVPPQMLDPSQQADLELALAEYEQIQWVNIERVESNLNLGWVRAARGDLEGAEQAYRKALRVDPEFVPAMVNLSDLYRQMEREAEGQRLLERAVGLQPDNGDVRHALGLLLARRGQLGQAIEELRRAAELSPQMARYAFVYGVALNSSGQYERAMAVLEETHRRFPGERDPLIALSAFARDAGDRDTAIRWATVLLELWPGDPEAQGMLAELQGR